jgi:hypothetical protein
MLTLLSNFEAKKITKQQKTKMPFKFTFAFTQKKAKVIAPHCKLMRKISFFIVDVRYPTFSSPALFPLVLSHLPHSLAFSLGVLTASLTPPPPPSCTQLTLSR